MSLRKPPPPRMHFPSQRLLSLSSEEMPMGLAFGGPPPPTGVPPPPTGVPPPPTGGPPPPLKKSVFVPLSGKRPNSSGQISSGYLSLAQTLPG